MKENALRLHADKFLRNHHQMLDGQDAALAIREFVRRWRPLLRLLLDAEQVTRGLYKRPHLRRRFPNLAALEKSADAVRQLLDGAA